MKDSLGWALCRGHREDADPPDPGLGMGLGLLGSWALKQIWAFTKNTADHFHSDVTPRCPQGHSSTSLPAMPHTDGETAQWSGLGPNPVTHGPGTLPRPAPLSPWLWWKRILESVRPEHGTGLVLDLIWPQAQASGQANPSPPVPG